MRYLSLQEVISLHSLLISQSGGSSGLRDRGALESAVAQPEASFGGPGRSVFRLGPTWYVGRPNPGDGQGVLHLGMQPSADEDRHMACSVNHVKEHSLRVATDDLFPFIASANQYFRFPWVGTRLL